MKIGYYQKSRVHPKYSHSKRPGTTRLIHVQSSKDGETKYFTRLNRNAPTSYQNFSSAAKHVHASHLRVLDSYCAQFNFNGTPGRKRKQTTTRRWISLSDKCDEYHNESCEYQIDNLIKFLLECSEDSEDPPEPLERDPQNDVVLDYLEIKN